MGRMTVRWALGAALAAGCGPPSVGEYAVELELAYCQWETECHRFASVVDCQEARRLDVDEDLEYMARAVQAGTAVYDEDAAVDCLGAIRGMSCEEEYPRPPESCDEVFRGRVGANAPCRSSLECAGDAICGFDPTCFEACCPGACRVLPGPLGEGEACGGGGLARCGEGLYCAVDPDTFVATVCEAVREVGAGCVFDEMCGEDGYCDGDVCAAYRERASGQSCERRGDRCVAPAECRYLFTDDGESRTCVTPGQLGADCDPLDSRSCARFDTFCDPATLECSLLPEPGAACSPEGCVGYASCRSGGDGGPGTCVALAGLGEACGEIGDDYVQCLGELVCDDRSVCAVLEEEASAMCPVLDG